MQARAGILKKKKNVHRTMARFRHSKCRTRDEREWKSSRDGWYHLFGFKKFEENITRFEIRILNV